MYICSMKTTKITATEIKKGMEIKVSSIRDTKEQLIDFLSKDFFTQEQKQRFQDTLDSNITLEVCKGTVKKDSPILNIKEVDLSNSYHFEGERGTVTVNIIVLVTDKGKFRISTRQKVELIN